MTGDADRDVKEETTLTGVSWYGQAKTAVDSTGLHAARVYKCRIPESAAPAGLDIAPGDQDHLRHRDRHRAGRA